MSRLRVLLAALPDILPIVERIDDDVLRSTVFDVLVQAALDDAAGAAEPLPMGGHGQVLAADPASPHGVSWRTPSEQELADATARTGTVYGGPVGNTSAGQVTLVTGDPQNATMIANEATWQQSPLRPAVPTDTIGGSTPHTYAEPAPAMPFQTAPSDSPTFDAVAREHQRP